MTKYRIAVQSDDGSWANFLCGFFASESLALQQIDLVQPVYRDRTFVVINT